MPKFFISKEEKTKQKNLKKMSKFSIKLIKKIKKTTSKGLIPSKKSLSDSKLTKIVVCHQNTDSTKWGKGMDIKTWASEFDCFESSEGAVILERLVLMAANVAFRKKFLRNQLRLSKVCYHGNIYTPFYHREAYSKHDCVVIHKKFRKNHTIRVKLFPYLIQNQGANPCWYKGSIQINRKWQTIRWCM
jgi:hypothetical protein